MIKDYKILLIVNKLPLPLVGGSSSIIMVGGGGFRPPPYYLSIGATFRGFKGLRAITPLSLGLLNVDLTKKPLKGPPTAP